MQVATHAPAEALTPSDLSAHYPVPRGAWVRANLVVSLDGMVTIGGRSGALSTSHDRAIFRYLRATSQVILVGKGTARAEGYRDAALDDAHLHLRADVGITRPLEIAVATRHPSKSTTGPIREIDLRAVEEGASLAELLGLDLTLPGGILLEGGPHLLGWMLAHSLVDEVCLTLRHLLVGSGELGLATATPPVGFVLASLIATEEASFLRLRREAAP